MSWGRSMNDTYIARVRREMARWRADHDYIPRFTDVAVTQDENDPTVVTVRMTDNMPWGSNSHHPDITHHKDRMRVEGSQDPVSTDPSRRDTDPAPPPVTQSIPPLAQPAPASPKSRLGTLMADLVRKYINTSTRKKWKWLK